MFFTERRSFGVPFCFGPSFTLVFICGLGCFGWHDGEKERRRKRTTRHESNGDAARVRVWTGWDGVHPMGWDVRSRTCAGV